MIHVSEGFQEKRIIQIADRISAQRQEVRIICIAGPSSSGKTTFIKRLNVQLQVNGLRPVPISLDNYYIDRERTPRDARGEYDFEAFEALSLDLLREHMVRLLAGEQVATAHYDFSSGKSHPTGGPVLTLGADDILSLEGIHGLNPALLPDIDPRHVFTIFVCPLAQLAFDRLNRINGSDVRLIRRIVRDRHGRNHNAAATIARWPSVRAGERAHIFPYQHNASAVFDTSLLYELSVLKVFAQRYLLEVDQTDASFATASRLLGLLDRFVTIYPDHVPPTSILREFIGSSGFEY
jgi:uridine kinase